MTVEDAAALEGAPKILTVRRGLAGSAQWWSAPRSGLEPWMVAVSIAGLLVGAATGYWLKNP